MNRMTGEFRHHAPRHAERINPRAAALGGYAQNAAGRALDRLRHRA